MPATPPPPLWRRLVGGPQAPAPRDRSALVAASVDISKRRIKRATVHEAWQQEAIELYSQVGELRYVANAQANAASRADLFVGRWEDGVHEPVRVEPGVIDEIWHQFGGGPLARAQLVRRLFLQLYVPGDGYIVGLPPGVIDDAPMTPGITDRVRLLDLSWHVMSALEVKATDDEVMIDLGDKPRRVPRDRVVLVRAWNPNPFRWWQADSPVRSNLPVLRELVGLTKHVSATIDSRLAGAGMLLIGDSFSLLAGQSPDPDDDPQADPIMAALMEAMLTAIRDRDSASAIMPIVLQGPDEAIDKVKHLTFSTPFDASTKDLREEAIRRLALGLDSPPEVLLGLGQSNHWNAWIIQDETIRTHIDPVLALICESLTHDFLWPMLEQAGIPDVADYAVWWDTSALTQRSDRSQEAIALYDRGELSGEALRREAGFEEDDAGDVDERRAVELALDLIKVMPSLLQNPGLQAIVDAIENIMSGRRAPQLLVDDEAEVVEEPVEADEPDEPNLEVPDAPDRPTVPEEQRDAPEGP